MKITDIKVHLPLGLLRIQTDAGIEGLSDGCGETCAEFIQQVYRPELLGQDPYHREVIWQRLMHLERLRYPPANVYRAVVDNALWDLAGKAAGMPVWKLLGATGTIFRAIAAAPIWRPWTSTWKMPCGCRRSDSRATRTTAGVVRR